MKTKDISKKYLLQFKLLTIDFLSNISSYFMALSIIVILLCVFWGFCQGGPHRAGRLQDLL